MTQDGVPPSWQGMPGLARVQRSGIPMVVFLVSAGGSGEGSPPLQHELIIPQWKTAESPMGEKVRPKALHFQRQELTTSQCEAWATYSTVITVSSVSPTLSCLFVIFGNPDETSLRRVTNL